MSDDLVQLRVCRKVVIIVIESELEGGAATRLEHLSHREEQRLLHVALVDILCGRVALSGDEFFAAFAATA